MSAASGMLVRLSQIACSASVECLFGSPTLLVAFVNMVFRNRNHGFSPSGGLFFFYSECQYFAIVL